MHCHSAFSFSNFLTSYSLSHFSFLTHHLQYLLHITKPLPNSNQKKSIKLITIIIKPFKLKNVHKTLSSINIQNLTITKIKNFKHQKKHTKLYQKTKYNINFLPKIKINITITNNQLNKIINIINKTTYTKKINNNKIFITKLQHIIHIHTNKTNKTTL